MAWRHWFWGRFYAGPYTVVIDDFVATERFGFTNVPIFCILDGSSREPLRDEVIPQGLAPVNAMVERAGILTTSPLPRYALQTDFAALFIPSLGAFQLDVAVADGRQKISPLPHSRAPPWCRTAPAHRAPISRCSARVVRSLSCRPARAY